MENSFLPGSLIEARDRIWVVQSGSTDDWLKLRPVGGADDEVTELSPKLEERFGPVKAAVYPLPNPETVGPLQSCTLLFNALRFQIRQGAGPFRSFGNIAVEPRSYQMVPLLMAMRMPTVRLLIADDVGVGKTIEAGLILRELYDRGEIENFAVLCPPHLVEQWTNELSQRFNFKATALTSSTGKKLEAQVPHGKKLLDVFPFLVVSLDYVKNSKHRDYFQAMDYRCIVVDEAHTCTQTGGSKQLRYDLLKKLAEDKERHLLFLTATPHSGNDDAFYNLLGLLKPEFQELKHRVVNANDPIRQDLAKHFVQRRRKDISEWQVSPDEYKVGFPKRKSAEVIYSLNEDWEKFFTAVQDFCRGIINKEAKNNQLIWYSVLSLFRCISSSPAAAVQALKNRVITGENIVCEFAEETSERPEDETPNIDQLPVNDEIKGLLTVAENLKNTKDDPKLKKLLQHIKELLKDGFNPVIFCSYIATAEYVADTIKGDPFFAKKLKDDPDNKKFNVGCVTGSLVPEERKEIVETLQNAEQRILVATDCLSEGINLQQTFNSVVHYDLAWNPTRHEQREGRVDRYGQKSPEVRCSMVYSNNNPVDGLIFNVILKKSKVIQANLGVLVPIPENEKAINQALIRATLFKSRNKEKPEPAQLSFELQIENEDGEMEDVLSAIETVWEDAFEKVKRTRTVFAQNTIHPEEISGLWEEQQETLGAHQDLEVFCRNASSSLGCHLEPLSRKGLFRIPTATFKLSSVKDRLNDEGIYDASLLDFSELHRTSGFVSTLSEALVEQALSGSSPFISRCAVGEIKGASSVTRVYLLRLRYQMVIRYRNQIRRRLMSEEIIPIAVKGIRQPEWFEGNEAKQFFPKDAVGNVAKSVAIHQIKQALIFIQENQTKLKELSLRRAEELRKEHQSVKEFTHEGSVSEVIACEPVDVMGVFVLLPEEE